MGVAAVVALIAASCVTSTSPPREAPHVAPSSSSPEAFGPSGDTTSIAPFASDATKTSDDGTPTRSPSREANAATTATRQDEGDSVQIEPLHHAGAFAWPRDAAERRALIVELARWNEGGKGAGARWHPQPRVVIGEPAATGGKADTKALMRALRAGQYGAVRRCYDEALRGAPKLEGRTIVRASIGGDGVVRSARAVGAAKGVADTRKHGHAMPDAGVRACLARSLVGARLPARRKVDVAFSIDLYPGDVPLPQPEGPLAPGRIDLRAADARLAANETSGRARRCLVDARRRGAGVWGRLALRLDLDASGKVVEAIEVESTFPDAEAVRCAAEALRGVGLGEVVPHGNTSAVVLALRLPEPPLGPTPEAVPGPRDGASDDDHGEP